MKKIIILALLGLISITSKGFSKNDTTIVEFSDKNSNKRIVVTSPQNDKFTVPLNLNIENLLKKLGVDSTERNKAIVLINKSENEADTLLILSQKGEEITITTKSRVKSPSQENPVVNEDRFSHENKDAEEEEMEEEDDFRRSKEETPAKPKPFFSKSDFGFYFGINNFQSSNSSGPNSLYKLRPVASRYIALSFRKHLTLSQSEKTDIAFSYAPEIAWYNFKFQNNNGIISDGGLTSFQDLGYDTKVSKLVLPHLNLPLMIHFGNKDSKLKIGLGTYFSYRFGAYSKVKDSNNNKDKIKDDFGLNPFLYGLTAEIGKRRGLTLFVRYGLNELFEQNQTNATGLKPLSFGLRI